MIDTMPQTNDECIKVIGELTRMMADEYQKWGESSKWKEMFDRLEAVKAHRQELKLLG